MESVAKMAAGRLCTAGALAGGGVRYKKGNPAVIFKIICQLAQHIFVSIHEKQNVHVTIVM